VAGTAESAPFARLSGDPEPAGRLPGNTHFSFAGCEGDSLLFLLDAAGVAVSTGSACQAGVPEPSHVLLAMGRPEEDARRGLRIPQGR
jgi:cysteine desulfurase